ncbi:MAG: threonine ammonia-lyase, biosynthetic [Ruminobacter sp.]|nr:threonine ammonia-lyase, biosynthetic [Ruminobacter sp.]MDY5778493.1 threonine ammonia-lyase, biosynthetic [Succinivibrionaceae bacterium]
MEQPTKEEYIKKILLSPVYDVAKVTPLEKLEKLSERLGVNVLIKREDRQVVHSFKLRGAYNKIANLPQDVLNKGVITASAGNHAQGVALTGTKLGIKATIVMPNSTPDIKVDAVKRFGGNVVLFGQNFDEANAEALRLAEVNGYTMIPPFDDPDVIAGQGTIAQELLKQNSHITHVFVQVGGGGLAAGMAIYIKALMPNVKVIAVESEGSACLKAAMEKGEPTSLDRVSLFADGVAVKRIGNETFRVLKDNIDEVITCSNDQICAAMKDIFEDIRAISEPSGALSLAGLKKYVRLHPELKNRSDVCMATVLSGANLKFHTLRFVSERCEVGEQTEAIISVEIPERMGSFLEFCKKLGGRTVTEFNYRYDSDVSAHVFVSIHLTKGPDEINTIIDSLTEAGYKVTNMTDNILAKNHVRYMIGGHSPRKLSEVAIEFEFPEVKDALLKFLETMGTQYNITSFHYRTRGLEYGSILCCFELDESNKSAFEAHLKELNYQYRDVTNDIAYLQYLRP